MTPDELRALADALEPMAAAPCFDSIDIPAAADYLRQCAEQRPDGWQLVPVEPTKAMKSAGGHVNSEWLNDDAPLYESRYAMSMDGVWSAMLAAAPAAPQPCWCHKCNEGRLVNGVPFAMTQMIVCPICGNKRCPHASDHALACTASNDPIAAPATPQAKKHPDEAAVDRFAAAMKSKLAEKRRQGKSGWDDPRCPTEHLAALLREHVVKGDPLDVGNFAMMLWCRGGSTNETQAEPKRPANKVIEVITEFDDIANWYGVILVVGETRHRFFMDYYTMQPADAEDFAETLRKALGITGDSDADR